MSKKKYLDEPIFDLPMITENEELFRSVVNEEEEKRLEEQEMNDKENKNG